MDCCNTDCPNYSLGPHAGKGRIRVATAFYCTVQSVGDAHPTRHGRPWHLQGPAGCVGWESKTALPEWRGKRVAPRAHTNLSCKGLMLQLLRLFKSISHRVCMGNSHVMARRHGEAPRGGPHSEAPKRDSPRPLSDHISVDVGLQKARLARLRDSHSIYMRA